MPFLPSRIPGYPVPPEHSLHRRQAHLHPFLRKSVMQDLCALVPFSPQNKDARHHFPGEFSWMVMWPGTPRGYDPSVGHSCSRHPSCDRALVVASVASDLSRTPSFKHHEPRCFHAQLGKLRIGCVGHVHILREGDAKVLNHGKRLTKQKPYAIR